MQKQKIKLAYLSEYLMANSDEEHPVTATDILNYLSSQGIDVARKVLYSDLEALAKTGLDIQSVRMGSTTGYFVGERDFQLPELKLLVDAVQSSKFITEKKSLELIGKLENLTSVHQAKQLRHQVWVRGRVKAMNESIYYNVDELNSAIEENRTISFLYFTWDREKKRVFRRNGERYRVSPWALLLDNENYYLLAWENGVMKHFRVDKMTDIRINDEPREGKEAFDDLDMAAYTDAHFGMFSGESTPVKLCFENSLAGVAVDFFGNDVMLVPYDDEHFTVTVNVAVNVQFFGWLVGLGGKARILEPESAAEEMGRCLASMLKRPFGSLLDFYDCILFVDTETTGLDPEKDHITETAVIKLNKRGQIARDRFFLRLPEGVSVPEEVSRLTGVTDEMCRFGLAPEKAARRLLSFAEGRTLFIAYNVQFDAAFWRKLTGDIPADYLDPLTVFRDRRPAPHNLSAASEAYGTKTRPSHRAAEDAQALMEVTAALENERDDLREYVNVIGYREKYGITGEKLPGVRYKLQQ